MNHSEQDSPYDNFAIILLNCRMWISGDTSDLINDSSEEYPVLIITGARQTGKTSLLQHIYPDINYITLDDPSLAIQAQYSPDDFISSIELPVIIDEAQYAPEIFPYIKIAVDNDKKPGQFFITGSQQFNLMENISESLTGRGINLEI